MTTDSTETEAVRAQAMRLLQAEADAAAERSRDRFWQNGPFNVQAWALRGFDTALAVLHRLPPEAGESPRDYLRRASAEIGRLRDKGPDLDDEGWYTGAIDEARSTLSSLS